jgi:hypothetical protein
MLIYGRQLPSLEKKQWLVHIFEKTLINNRGIRAAKYYLITLPLLRMFLPTTLLSPSLTAVSGRCTSRKRTVRG